MPMSLPSPRRALAAFRAALCSSNRSGELLGTRCAASSLGAHSRGPGLQKGSTAMQDRFFTAIREGMEVYDRDDDKVGKVGKLYRPASAVASTGTAPGSY